MEEKQFSDVINSRLKGFTSYCGLDFTEIADEKCVISCRLRPELLNPSGIAHGGLIATLTDVAAGMMALQADHWRRYIVTQNCNLHYLRPGIGEVLRAESRVIRKGNRVCVL
jgi:acyl-CoA thioesterase